MEAETPGFAVQWASVLAALAIAGVHVASPRLHVLDGVPRNRWLSFAGGVSVAYVFVHLLPELSHLESESVVTIAGVPAETEIFLVSLAGLTLFYCVETVMRKRSAAEGGEGRGAAFAFHLAVFAIYNLLIGQTLVHRLEDGLANLALYAVAMGLHFFVNDRALARHHGREWYRFGRWVAAAAVLAGLALGLAEALGETATALTLALLAGGVVLNVMKEELPRERESRFGAFLAGVVLFSLLDLAAA